MHSDALGAGGAVMAATQTTHWDIPYALVLMIRAHHAYRTGSLWVEAGMNISRWHSKRSSAYDRFSLCSNSET
jgi:hypothetical protein